MNEIEEAGSTACLGAAVNRVSFALHPTNHEPCRETLVVSDIMDYILWKGYRTVVVLELPNN